MFRMDSDKRFIEETFPVREVSIESAREKNIRHGHISTLHAWWARRPLASSRAANYAALIPRTANAEECSNKRQFIVEFSRWENSLNQRMIGQARKDILKANGGRPPKVLDPFGGGGSIPLEALRLGCETYSGDLNPVAVLIQKCTLEYPQRYGKPREAPEEVGMLTAPSLVNPLVEDVQRWGNWISREARKEIGAFYPPEDDGSVPVAYIWARTIPCQNVLCQAEIPLMRQFWLAKKDSKRIALYPYVENGEVKFRIVGDGYDQMPRNFDPKTGTVSRAVARCLICGSVVDDQVTRRLFQEGYSGQRMVAVVLSKPETTGKSYRPATERDMRFAAKAGDHLTRKEKELTMKWGMDPIPDEVIPSTMPGGIHTPAYGMTTWGSLFNERQKLALVTFVERLRKAYYSMLSCGYEDQYAVVVTSYLAIAVDRIAIYQTSLGYWHNTRELVNPGMGRQALQMAWDYAESNVLEGNGDWDSALGWITRVVEHCASIPGSEHMAPQVAQCSATSLPYADDYFDAVFTDPPYYYNITYADLSDFFYVWLKRTIGDLYPELFSTPLTPKSSPP